LVPFLTPHTLFHCAFTRAILSMYFLLLVPFLFLSAVPSLYAVHFTKEMYFSIGEHLHLDTLVALPPIFANELDLTKRIQKYFNSGSLKIYPGAYDNVVFHSSVPPKLPDTSVEEFKQVRKLLNNYGYGKSGKKLEVPANTDEIIESLSNLFVIGVAGKDKVVGEFYRIFCVPACDVIDIIMSVIPFSSVNLREKQMPPIDKQYQALKEWLDSNSGSQHPIPPDHKKHLNYPPILAPRHEAMAKVEVYRQIVGIYTLPWLRDYVVLGNGLKSFLNVFLAKECTIVSLIHEYGAMEEERKKRVEERPKPKKKDCTEFYDWLKNMDEQ